MLLKCKQLFEYQHLLLLIDISGLYYKHILMIVSDDRKWRQYYKCAYDHIDDASLAS